MRGIRVKGGIQYGDYLDEPGFYPIVHVWDNIDCVGEAEQWTVPVRFDTEDEAMDFYKNNVQPLLKELAVFTDMGMIHKAIDEIVLS